MVPPRPARATLVSPDVSGELQRIRGARPAFDALAPSHRRELIRYIDDARTARTRARRIHNVAAHVLGKLLPATGRQRAVALRQRPLWTCPLCGNQFVNRNQYHSCRRYRLADVFEGKPRHIRQLFDELRHQVRGFGAVKVQAYRDHVAFVVRVRFARARPRSRWLDVSFWLPRRIDHARMNRIETIHPEAHVHHVRITAARQVDRQLVAWLREAYAVGCQEHLR